MASLVEIVPRLEETRRALLEARFGDFSAHAESLLEAVESSRADVRAELAGEAERARELRRRLSGTQALLLRQAAVARALRRIAQPEEGAYGPEGAKSAPQPTRLLQEA